MRRFSFFLVVCVFIGIEAIGEIVPGSLFGDNMVLQRNKNAAVWGSGSDGEQVSVSIKSQTKYTVVSNGLWKVYLDPEPAGGPYTLSIATTGQTTVFTNVMFGEVWFAGGQSNMRFPLWASTGASELFASGVANLPMLRLFAMPERINELNNDLPITGWMESSNDSASDFSAVAWYFGMHLQEQLDIPVGIVMSARGGTPAEAWMDSSYSAECLPFAVYANEFDAQYHASYASFEEYQIAYNQYLAAPPPYPEPVGPYSSQRPSGLYGTMIEPLAPFTLAGFLWYQGEGNAWRAYDYRAVLTTLIKNWRRDFEDESLPFLVVQLPGFGSATEIPAVWAELRDSQFYVSQNIPGVGLAVIPELGDSLDIHPTQKEPVGYRLSLLARGMVYGESLTYSGPLYSSVQFAGALATVSFDHIGGGLVQQGATLNGFTICGADRVFYPAEASIVGETVVVSSAQVSAPVAVRYLWQNGIDESDVNLFNDADLPASPFRTDDFRLVTQADPAADALFKGTAGVDDPSWNNPFNWDPVAVPTSSTYVRIVNLYGHGVVVSNSGAVASGMEVGVWGWTGNVDITAAGTLSVGNSMVIAGSAGKTGTVVNAGQTSLGGGIFMRDGTGRLVNSGTLTATGVVMGDSITAESTVFNTGTMTINGWLWLSNTASNTPAVFNMDGGTLTITGNLATQVGGSGHINLNAGTITAGGLQLVADGAYTIDISAGVLIINGNRAADMNGLASMGLITAYGGATEVVVAYDAGLNQTRLSAADFPPDGPGEFFIAETGEQFSPVGFNYVDLRTNDIGQVWHNTFNPNTYNAATVSANMAEIAAAKFNTLRVFIESGPTSNSVTVAETDTTLSVPYMQCVADFLEQAHAHGLHVVITFGAPPWTWEYAQHYDTVTNVLGGNQYHLNPGWIFAKRLYMRDFIQLLGQLAPERLADTVLAFDPQNECCFDVASAPFSLSSGTVTPANGKTYDLVTEKVQLADDMAVYWMDQMAEEIHQQAPGVLVDFNIFTYHAVSRAIGDFHIIGADWIDRYPFRPLAMARSGADYFNVHVYTANSTDLQAELDSIEFTAVSNAWTAAGKPMIVGEFGAFKSALPPLEQAAEWKRVETDVFASLGFQGWLYWTYNTDLQPELWNAKSGTGELFDALAAGARVNYFGYPPAADDLDSDGLPDSWEIQYFGGTNAVNGGASEDFDGDDMANRNEYLAGTIPNDPTSEFSMVGAPSGIGGFQIQWSTIPGNSYQVLRSASLVGPQWSTVGAPVVGTGAVSALTVPVDAKEAFYKVRKDR